MHVCLQAKSLFQNLSVPATVIETDVVAGGPQLREGLEEVTGRRTVPQVFIGGKHVGGCDGAWLGTCIEAGPAEFGVFGAVMATNNALS